ncbi:hypothetical protein FFT09_22610 [Saccharomonospora piscinae]|uniref:hypothetical protein n=1 Tax=Saccharomonospora piscinae TaxID=687388 RepID=UPI001106F4F3|nr:hypothetical protein [Saccharomonospora piscinae]TLW89226.1 hypothetical protein FFT09_22610 [Saccharomonospora piscinae]
MSADSAGDDPGLHFPPVVNGVDFLDSAIENLLHSDDPRKLKYAVLHLQAAVEILLKVRLQREGIAHVFADPSQADESKLAHGKFISVSWRQAVTRLERVAGVCLSKGEQKSLQRLSDERNKLQHFGSTADRNVITSCAGDALNVTSEFIHNHLLPEAPPDEVESLKRAQVLIDGARTEIEDFRKARMKAIAPELEAWPGLILNCPECTQLAWTFAPEDENWCRFCRHDWSQDDGHEIAELYAENVLDESQHLAAQGRDSWSVSLCPVCDDTAFVDVYTRDHTDEPLGICFACGLTATADRRASCGGCGRTTLDRDDLMLCPGCLQYRMDKDP